MTGRYIRFLLLVLALMLVDALCLIAALRVVPSLATPVPLLILATVYFLCIPLNMYIAWKLVMRGAAKS